jgi:SpoVK/Ycf46/Vps4 family AAA+-type ATPase
MSWSPQQDAALKAVAEWLRRGDRPVFRLFGYAGTGKTTLAKHIARVRRGWTAIRAKPAEPGREGGPDHHR